MSGSGLRPRAAGRPGLRPRDGARGQKLRSSVLIAGAVIVVAAVARVAVQLLRPVPAMVLTASAAMFVPSDNNIAALLARWDAGSEAFRRIVALPQVTLPVAGVAYNVNAGGLGHNGIIGVKTGSSSQAGGCLAFAAIRTVAGSQVTIVGAGPPVRWLLLTRL